MSVRKHTIFSDLKTTELLKSMWCTENIKAKIFTSTNNTEVINTLVHAF